MYHFQDISASLFLQSPDLSYCCYQSNMKTEKRFNLTKAKDEAR